MIWSFALALCQTMPAQSPWPGQSGNPVGYTAYGDGILGTTSCGALSSGVSGAYKIYSKCVAGDVSVNFAIFSQVDFPSGSSITGSNLVFIGCRFQSNNTQFANVIQNGTNVAFLYSSFTPLASLYTVTPGLIWPAAGAGTNSLSQTVNVNSIAASAPYQYGIHQPSGPMWLDHSEFWGFGNAIDFSGTTAQITITNSWFHDACYLNDTCPSPSPNDYHTDGPGYLNGGTGPSNVTIVGNTIATIGNTHDIAFQAGNGGYDKLIVEQNYLSGNQYAVSWCSPGSKNCTHSAFYGNVYGTDIMPSFGQLYPSSIDATSVWACNTIAFRPGTTWTDPQGEGWHPTSGMNGQYWTPDDPNVNSTTDEGGNTVCGLPAPSSLDFDITAVNSTSPAQTITLKSTNTGSLNITSIALQTGTQYAIASNNCGTTLTSGGSCTITVTFTPTSQGIKSDNLQITANTPSPSSPINVPLIGVGSDTATVVPPTGLSAIVK